MKKSNVHIIGTLDREETGKEEIFEEAMTEIFPKLIKSIKLEI